jgi:hypothetical protein
MTRSNIIPLALRYAGMIGATLLVYFLLMKLFHFETVIELRFINFFIMLVGLRFFMVRLKNENKGALEYLSSLAYGFLVSVLTSVFFGAFIFLYLSFIDKGMMEHLQANQPFGEYLTPGSALLVLILEGCSSGAIISFMLVQFMSRESKVKQAD